MPNCIEFIEAKLATISLGAVWSCASPDFGAQSVVERFKQISPKVIFSVSSVYYNGKKHDHVAKLNEVVKGYFCNFIFCYIILLIFCNSRR